MCIYICIYLDVYIYIYISTSAYIMYVHTCIRWLRAAFRTWSKIFLSAPAPGTVRVCIWACASFALALAIILSDDLEYRCAASAESAAYMRMCVYINIC